MRKILITIIFALLAVIFAIAFSPNKPSQDWERLIHGGAARPSPSRTPRKLTPEEQRDGVNRKRPIAEG